MSAQIGMSAELDTKHFIETPEGVAVAYRAAGVPVRIAAYALDLLYRLGFYILFSIAASFLGAFGAGLASIAFFVVEWWYPIWFEIFRDGRTPGKKKMNIMVVSDNGTPISFSASMIRNLLRAVDFLPLFYFTGLSSMLLNSKFKRVGDYAAGCMVVYCPEPGKVTSNLEDSTVLRVTLNRAERKAIVRFSERCGQLSIARQEELATILKPMLVDLPDKPLPALLRIAKGAVSGQ